MIKYTVKHIAKLSGVSVRTLHHYDKIDLLKPNSRSESGYRLYGEAELLKLQQILFYKEFGFSLTEVANMFKDPKFDLIEALQKHRLALEARQRKTYTLLNTIDKTLMQLQKGQNMINTEDLYEGFDKETAEKYHKEAIDKYGKESVERSMKALDKMEKKDSKLLIANMKKCMHDLFELRELKMDDPQVQQKISEFYLIIRSFWGTANMEDPQAEQFSGLGKLYVCDERFTMIDGKAQPEFAKFMAKAMQIFSENLKPIINIKHKS